MREIKFRAWDKANKLMLVPLSGIVWGKACVPTDYVQGLFDYDIPDNYSYWGDGEMMLVADCEIMQFIDLPDRSGKEMCEGDILAIESLYDKLRAVVEWGKTQPLSFWDRSETWLVRFPKLGRSGPLYPYCVEYHGYNIEVIGNIYENEDLLST